MQATKPNTYTKENTSIYDVYQNYFFRQHRNKTLNKLSAELPAICSFNVFLKMFILDYLKLMSIFRENNVSALGGHKSTRLFVLPGRKSFLWFYVRIFPSKVENQASANPGERVIYLVGRKTRLDYSLWGPGFGSPSVGVGLLQFHYCPKGVRLLQPLTVKSTLSPADAEWKKKQSASIKYILSEAGPFWPNKSVITLKSHDCLNMNKNPNIIFIIYELNYLYLTFSCTNK